MNDKLYLDLKFEEDESTPAVIDYFKQWVDYYIQEILSQRKEILEAFIEKFNCSPEEATQVEQRTPDGSIRYYIRKKTPEEIEFDNKNKNDYSSALKELSTDWLTDISEKIHQNKIDKGWKITTDEDWKDSREIPSVLMLIVSEVSEALEAFRKNDKENFKEELADVMIRTIGLAHGKGIDIKKAITDKVEYNSKREFKHGGKRI